MNLSSLTAALSRRHGASRDSNVHGVLPCKTPRHMIDVFPDDLDLFKDAMDKSYAIKDKRCT